MKPLTTETRRRGESTDSRFVIGFNAGLERAATHLLQEQFDNADVYAAEITKLKVSEPRAKSQKPKAGVA